MTMLALNTMDRQVVHDHKSKPSKLGQSFGFQVMESELGHWYGRLTITSYDDRGQVVKYWGSEPFMLLAKIKVKVEALNEMAVTYRKWMVAIGAWS